MTMLEDRLRTGLRDATDAVTASPELPALVRERIAAHEQRIRATRQVLVGALACSVLAAVLVIVQLGGDDRGRTRVATPRSGIAGWAPIGDAPVAPRFQHVAVWTGDELVTFGGYDDDGKATGGAAYDPAVGTWRRIADPPGDLGGPIVAWTGEMILVLGTEGGLDAYDPAADEWTSLAGSPLPTPLSNAVGVGVWTGTELVVAVGKAESGRATRAATAAYDPDTDAWRELAPTPFPMTFPDAAWTGGELVVVTDRRELGDAHPSLQVWAFDPAAGAAGAWTQLPAPPLADVERRLHGFAAWTGSELLVGGGASWSPAAAGLTEQLVAEDREPTPAELAIIEARPRNDVAAWDPATGTWRSLPPAPVPLDGQERWAEVWTGTTLVVWEAGRTGRPVLLDPVAGRWLVADAPPEGLHQEAPATWTGEEVVVWSGEPSASDADPAGCCRPLPVGATFTP